MAVTATAHLDLLAPLSGLIVPLASVPDPVFAHKMAGDGLAIDPTSTELLAPCAGTVTQLHKAHHAVAIRSEAGVEVLVHLGLDTVTLRGEGFTPKVKVGDCVRAGQVLIVFDPVVVGRKARSLLTQMVLPGGGQILSMHAAEGLVVAGKDVALRVELGDPGARSALAGAVAAHAVVAGPVALSGPVALPNPSGLHARPAAVLAGAAKRFTAEVLLVRDAEEVNAKSVLAILGLATKQGEVLRVKVTGPDAQEASRTLADLLAKGCGEDPGAAPPGEAPSPVGIVPCAPGTLRGVPASPGLALGRVFQYRPQVLEVMEAGQGLAQEQARLEAALRDGGFQLEAIKARVRMAGNTTREGILGAHQELLADPELARRAQAGLDAGKSAAFAWREAYTSFAAKLETLAVPLLRERANDVRDVGRRVLALLTGAAPVQVETPPEAILIAEELTPSEAAQLDRTKILGLCTTTGGPTGHVAILARSLGIPALCAVEAAALALPDQALVVLDGSKGLLRTEPTPADLQEARERMAQQAVQRSWEQGAAQQKAVTADGFSLEVAANICTVQEAREAVAAGAEGIGLLRSEFLFLDRSTAPTEEEQAAAYAAVAESLGPGRKCVIRTLDVGGDKPLAYLPLPQEANPFLGMRGVRVSLDQPGLFRTQLRAILRAVPLGDVHILFPMVATLEELRAAKAILGEEADALGLSAKVGIMMEVPSAVLIAEALAQEVDFFSLGTNDLAQYCLAMDRGHPKLAPQADALHPGVLKLIDLAVASAHRHGKWVGVCGGLASDLLALPALVGLGVDELSVSVPAIGSIKARLARLRKTDCEALARELLRLSTASAVRERLGTVVP